MKSIKPGRGPSMMGGVMGIFAAVFGVIWTVSAAAMGAGFFSLFGLVFIGIAVMNAVYSFKNATSKNRYSAYDITEEGEEPDPLNVRFEQQQKPYTSGTTARFCPYCGRKIEQDFEFFRTEFASAIEFLVPVVKKDKRYSPSCCLQMLFLGRGSVMNLSMDAGN